MWRWRLGPYYEEHSIPIPSSSTRLLASSLMLTLQNQSQQPWIMPPRVRDRGSCWYERKGMNMWFHTSEPKEPLTSFDVHTPFPPAHLLLMSPSLCEETQECIHETEIQSGSEYRRWWVAMGELKLAGRWSQSEPHCLPPWDLLGRGTRLRAGEDDQDCLGFWMPSAAPIRCEGRHPFCAQDLHRACEWSYPRLDKDPSASSHRYKSWNSTSQALLMRNQARIRKAACGSDGTVCRKVEKTGIPTLVLCDHRMWAVADDDHFQLSQAHATSLSRVYQVPNLRCKMWNVSLAEAAPYV